MNATAPQGVSERTGAPTPAELGYPEIPPLVIVRGWRDEHGNYQCQTVTDGWGCRRCAGCAAYAASKETVTELTGTQNARRTINGTDGAPNDSAVFTYGGDHRLVIWQKPNGEPRTVITSMEFVRQHEKNQRTIAEVHAHNARVAAERVKSAGQPARAREAQRRSSTTSGTSTTRTTVTASAAGSSDSSAGSSRSGSRPPSAEDDPAPPDRLKISHTYVVDTAGSVVDGCTMLMGVAP
jgi:hypothetical protein